MRRCKMASVVFRCPLCCGESYSSRESLREHLLSAKNSLCCPACLVTFEGISHLIDHLGNDKCNATATSEAHRKGRMKQIKLSGGLMVQPPPIQSSNNASAPLEKVFIQEKKVGLEKVNLKILNSKDPLSEEVRNRVTLLGDDNESHIIIVAEQSDSEDDAEGRAIIDGNQQNIILTQENAIPGTAEEGEDDILSQEGDLYSCNSCSMSFTSVLEHIQKYHNDQEVVLEMTEDHKTEAIGNNDGNQFLLEGQNQNVNQNETEDILNKTIKYIITDSGEIVEADSEEKHLITVEKPRRGGKKPQPSLKEEACQDKDGRQYIRRIVQIDKFWNTEGSKAEQKNFANNDHKAMTKTVPAGKVLVPQVGKSLTLDVGPDSTADEQNQTVFYQCASCNYPLMENDIKDHVCEQDPPIYPCPQCPVTYTSSKSLCAHMKIHKDYKQDKKASSSVKNSGKSADANGTLFRCKVCNTIFPTNKSLRLHARMHEPLRVRQVDGPVHYTSAGIKDENNDLLNTAASELTMDIDGAKNVGHDDHKDKYLCKLCDKWIHCGYKDIHDNYHESGNEFNCEICNRKFFTAENLMMHMSVHSTEKPQTYSSKKVLPYQCLYCNRQFSRPHEKVKHERIHTGEKPHSCDICGKSFRVSYCLTLHMRTHTGARPYSCGHCGKRFKAHSVYNHHLLTHSDVRAYKCCYCPKAFKTSVQLAGHKNSHTKPFSCTQCNRPFASLYAVRVHMETHQRQNNLKYRCALCGASYARAFALKDHVKSQHGCELFEISAKEIIVEEPSNDSPDLNNDDKVSKDEPEEAAAALAILPKVENFIENEDEINDHIVY